jgi:hypothetical protein
MSDFHLTDTPAILLVCSRRQYNHTDISTHPSSMAIHQLALTTYINARSFGRSMLNAQRSLLLLVLQDGKLDIRLAPVVT